MIIKNVNVTKLHEELYKAGIELVDVGVNLDGSGEFLFTDDTDMELVQSIIDAHDSTPIPPQPTKEEILERQVSTNMDYLLDVDFRLMLLEFGMV